MRNSGRQLPYGLELLRLPELFFANVSFRDVGPYDQTPHHISHVRPQRMNVERQQAMRVVLQDRQIIQPANHTGLEDAFDMVLNACALPMNSAVCQRAAFYILLTQPKNVFGGLVPAADLSEKDIRDHVR